MRSHLLASALLLCSFSSAIVLNGCTSAQDEALANSVITALPNEVRGCVFLGNVDTAPRMTIENARFDLKLKAGMIGATHVTESYAYAQLLNRLSRDVGIALSGRAYRCPHGLGPIISDPQAKARLPYSLPQPTLNDDDPFYWH